MRPYTSLRRRREFTLAMRRGGIASTPALTAYVFAPSKRESSASKAGIIVTKKVGTAVVRNRIKRRCKAILQTVLAQAPPRWCVIQCKPQAGAIAYQELRRQLVDAMTRAERPKKRSA